MYGVYVHLESYDLAVEVLLEALKLKPSSEEVLSTLGNHYFDVNQLEEGIVFYERALLQKKQPEFFFYIATAHMRLGNKEKALLNYIKAEDLDIDGVFSKKEYLYNNLGELYEHHFKNTSMALEYYNKELEGDPESYGGLLNKFKRWLKQKIL